MLDPVSEFKTLAECEVLLGRVQYHGSISCYQSRFTKHRVVHIQTFLPGFGYGWLKYCAIVQFWGGQRNILRVILKT